MRESVNARRSRTRSAPGPTSGSERAPAPVARALALQRQAGNRATARLLSRWVKHPDAEKTGVMVPDASATEYLRFNPPTNE